MAKRTFYLLLLLAPLVAGCGQKGPLYLPDQNTQHQDGENR